MNDKDRNLGGKSTARTRGIMAFTKWLIAEIALATGVTEYGKMVAGGRWSMGIRYLRTNEELMATL